MTNLKFMQEKIAIISSDLFDPTLLQLLATLRKTHHAKQTRLSKVVLVQSKSAVIRQVCHVHAALGNASDYLLKKK